MRPSQANLARVGSARALGGNSGRGTASRDPTPLGSSSLVPSLAAPSGGGSGTGVRRTGSTQRLQRTQSPTRPGSQRAVTPQRSPSIGAQTWKSGTGRSTTSPGRARGISPACFPGAAELSKGFGTDSSSSRRTASRGPQGEDLVSSQKAQAMHKYLVEQLCVAVRHGDVQGVRTCLNAGASADERDQHGWAPLHYGASCGHVEACQALLESSSDLEVQLPDLSTPLMLAAEEGHLDVARLLLNHGAWSEQKDEDGFTALERCDAATKAEFAGDLMRRNRESS